MHPSKLGPKDIIVFEELRMMLHGVKLMIELMITERLDVLGTGWQKLEWRLLVIFFLARRCVQSQLFVVQVQARLLNFIWCIVIEVVVTPPSIVRVVRVIPVRGLPGAGHLLILLVFLSLAEA